MGYKQQRMLQLKDMTDDLKYLTRLNKTEFHDLFFAGSNFSYVNRKWDIFNRDKMGFIWGCSLDKLQIVVDYIERCKNE